MSRPRRALGYARVSSEEQARGSSLRDQQASIKAYADTRGVAVAQLYVEAESGIRAREEHREQMRLLLHDVRAGDLVLCDKLDRWSRDPEFTYGSVRRILEAGASFYAVADRCDPSTPEGDTALGFRILFAREEHKRIKERMCGTRNILRDQGYYASGVTPLGYRRSAPKGSRGLAKNVLVVVPEEAELVRAIFRLYVGGLSMEKVAAKLEVSPERVRGALGRRFYIGETQISPSRPGARDGEWIKGRHEPIIDVGLFMRANAIVEQRRRGGPRDVPAATTDWILRDVARCGRCDARMRSSYSGPIDAYRQYYACSRRCASKGPRRNTGTYVPVRAVEAAFSPLVLERLAELREDLAKEPGRKSVRGVVDLGAQRARLVRRREKYLEAFADDLMTAPELRTAMAKLDVERLRLDAKEQREPVVGTEVRRELLRSLRELTHAWNNAAPPVARGIVNMLAVSVALAAGVAPRPVWRTAEELAQDRA